MLTASRSKFSEADFVSPQQSCKVATAQRLVVSGLPRTHGGLCSPLASNTSQSPPLLSFAHHAPKSHWQTSIYDAPAQPIRVITPTLLCPSCFQSICAQMHAWCACSTNAGVERQTEQAWDRQTYADIVCMEPSLGFYDSKCSTDCMISIVSSDDAACKIIPLWACLLQVLMNCRCCHLCEMRRCAAKSTIANAPLLANLGTMVACLSQEIMNCRRCNPRNVEIWAAKATAGDAPLLAILGAW